MFQNTASFPGIARGNSTLLRQLVVTDVVQKAGIELDETGTVAYAATGNFFLLKGLTLGVSSQSISISFSLYEGYHIRSELSQKIVLDFIILSHVSLKIIKLGKNVLCCRIWCMYFLEINLTNRFGDDTDDFEATHPFIFLIQDDKSGITLFAGILNNPLEGNPEINEIQILREKQ